MIRKIKNYIIYKKKLKLLKRYAVTQIANIVINKSDYVTGLQNLLLAASQADNEDKLKQLIKEFTSLMKMYGVINDQF